MKDCYETLRELNAAPSEAVAIGGGIKSALWRQILADMLGIPLATVENVDSSLGSAMLAGVAAGVFCDHKDAVAHCVRVTGKTLPDPEGQAVLSSGVSKFTGTFNGPLRRFIMRCKGRNTCAFWVCVKQVPDGG